MLEVDKIVREAATVTPRVANLLKEAVLSAPKVTYLKHTGPVTQTKRGGRRVFITYKGKEIVAKISGSRTKVKINGKPGKRKNVKKGMTCTFVYLKMGGEAKELNCKN